MAVIAVPGPSGSKRRTKIRREETGSVVGIQIRGWSMYTGTLIQDLMAAVELAEMRVEQRRVSDEQELERLYQLQIPAMRMEQVLAGAA
jgi:hypothetical protein